MKILCALLAGFCLLLPATSAGAEDFPARQLRLIVPFPPGGPADLNGRAVSEPLGRRLWSRASKKARNVSRISSELMALGIAVRV